MFTLGRVVVSKSALTAPYGPRDGLLATKSGDKQTAMLTLEEGV